MRPCRSGKGLLHAAFLQKRCKCSRGVLFSAVAVKSEAAGIAALPKSGSESAGDQVRACVVGYPIADDLAGEQIQDDAKVDPVVVDLEIRNVTDPDLIGAVCGELLIQQVLLSILLTFFVLLLGVGADAVQIQLLHDRRDAFGADPDTALGQRDANLFSAEALSAVIEYMLHEPHELHLFLITLAMVSPAKDIVVESASGNLQCFAEFIDAVCFAMPTFAIRAMLAISSAPRPAIRLASIPPLN